jgi:hypothetical protein
VIRAKVQGNWNLEKISKHGTIKKSVKNLHRNKEIRLHYYYYYDYNQCLIRSRWV